MQDRTIIRMNTSPEGFGETPDALTEDMFASALPTQHSHESYEDDALGLYIGVWDTTDMIEAAGPYECDEFMWLIEGHAEIRNNRTGVVEIARAGEAFIIPRGYECQWHQSGYLRKFFVIWEHPDMPIPETPAHEGIIIPRADADLAPTAIAAPFQVTTGAQAHEHICYRDTTGAFLSGTWASDAFDSQARSFPYNEFACIHSGSIALTDETGEEFVFGSGEAFFVPEGLVCSGRVDDQVTLFFSIVKSS